MKQQVGVIGMGVMGKSLSRNLARNGFTVSLYNRHVVGSEENVAQRFQQEHEELISARSFNDLALFISSLERPRKIVIMVNAGLAVDKVLEAVTPFLEKGDIVLDGGNSHYEDTRKRMEQLEEKGFHLLGAGVSGGKEGALWGPSIMPSGNEMAYAAFRPFLEKIAAKTLEGLPCCAYIGEQGSGHFVKMVHNGIEYVEMQLIAECYSILKAQGLKNDEIAAAFNQWKEDCGSYLLEISTKILRKKDGEAYLLDFILDKAANKGTGSWSTQSIAVYGEAATLIPAALFSRYLSFFKSQREKAATIFSSHPSTIEISLQQLKVAYQFARMVNHHQGFSFIERTALQENWSINLSTIAQIWTEGSIIKSDLMKSLTTDLKTSTSLLTHPSWQSFLKQNHSAAKEVAKTCINSEIHAPCLLEAINFFHGFISAQLPANMIQAQRDFFGAHTYQRNDDTSRTSHHTQWD